MAFAPEPIHWVILGVVLVIGELLLPSMVLLWLGLGGLLTGAILFFVPDLSWQIQFLIFGGFSLVATLAGRRWWRKRSAGDDKPTVNLGSKGLIGRHVRITQAITAGRGRAKVGDGEWLVAGPDMPVGAEAEVVDADGTLLTVAPVQGQDQGSPAAN